MFYLNSSSVSTVSSLVWKYL